MNKKSIKRKPLTQEQIDKRIKTVFKRKIRNIFTGMGFTYVPTNDHEMVIGLRKVEIDALFIFENIWLLCEDTIKSANIKEHISRLHCKRKSRCQRFQSSRSLPHETILRDLQGR